MHDPLRAWNYAYLARIQLKAGRGQVVGEDRSQGCTTFTLHWSEKSYPVPRFHPPQGLNREGTPRWSQFSDKTETITHCTIPLT